MIKLKRDEICPADIVLLDTSFSKEKEKVCFVDASHINGTSTLETKKACRLARQEFEGKLEYEAPTEDLSHFTGELKLKTDPAVKQLSIDNLVLRGSVLRNTDW